LIIFSDDGLKKVGPRLAELPETCSVYADDALELPATKAKVQRYPFTRVSKQIDRLSIGVVALSAMLQDAGMFPLDAFSTAIRAFQKPKIADINVRALEAGAELAKAGQRV
jgi:Pyruvate/2-oxoacid:ferredoxin oxidoreductase gamma subunit